MGYAKKPWDQYASNGTYWTNHRTRGVRNRFYRELHPYTEEQLQKMAEARRRLDPGPLPPIAA